MTASSAIEPAKPSKIRQIASVESRGGAARRSRAARSTTHAAARARGALGASASRDALGRAGRRPSPADGAARRARGRRYGTLVSTTRSSNSSSRLMNSARWLCRRRCQRCGLMISGITTTQTASGSAVIARISVEQRLPEVAVGRRHDLDRDRQRPRRPGRARLRDVVGAELDVQADDVLAAEAERVAEGVARGRVELGDRQQHARLLLARRRAGAARARRPRRARRRARRPPRPAGAAAARASCGRAGWRPASGA